MDTQPVSDYPGMNDAVEPTQPEALSPQGVAAIQGSENTEAQPEAAPVEAVTQSPEQAEAQPATDTSMTDKNTPVDSARSPLAHSLSTEARDAAPNAENELVEQDRQAINPSGGESEQPKPGDLNWDPSSPERRG